MARANSKEAILEAAEAIVLEDGAAHLTLDAVAERAKVSKGGLIYHFPSKEALLVGMMERSGRRFDQSREAFMTHLPPGPSQMIKAEIKSHMGLQGANDRISAGILAVLANRPELAGAFREQFGELFAQFTQETSHKERAAILLFATYGLGLMELLQMSPIDGPQRQAIEEELLRQADSEI